MYVLLILMIIVTSICYFLIRTKKKHYVKYDDFIPEYENYTSKLVKVYECPSCGYEYSERIVNDTMNRNEKYICSNCCEIHKSFAIKTKLKKFK